MTLSFLFCFVFDPEPQWVQGKFMNLSSFAKATEGQVVF